MDLNEKLKEAVDENVKRAIRAHVVQTINKMHTHAALQPQQGRLGKAEGSPQEGKYSIIGGDAKRGNTLFCGRKRGNTPGITKGNFSAFIYK